MPKGFFFCGYWIYTDNILALYWSHEDCLVCVAHLHPSQPETGKKKWRVPTSWASQKNSQISLLSPVWVWVPCTCTDKLHQTHCSHSCMQYYKTLCKITAKKPFSFPFFFSFPLKKLFLSAAKSYVSSIKKKNPCPVQLQRLGDRWRYMNVNWIFK